MPIGGGIHCDALGGVIDVFNLTIFDEFEFVSAVIVIPHRDFVL